MDDGGSRRSRRAEGPAGCRSTRKLRGSGPPRVDTWSWSGHRNPRRHDGRPRARCNRSSSRCPTVAYSGRPSRVLRSGAPSALPQECSDPPRRVRGWLILVHGLVRGRRPHRAGACSTSRGSPQAGRTPRTGAVATGRVLMISEGPIECPRPRIGIEQRIRSPDRLLLATPHGLQAHRAQAGKLMSSTSCTASSDSLRSV